jgi:hypothetical protein
MLTNIIVREDASLRGRSFGEVNKLVVEGIKIEKPDIPVKVIEVESEAIKYALKNAKKNDLLIGGPEGFVHISEQNPGFPVDGLLVSEWSAGNLAAYDVDDNGDPINNTRRDFVTGLTGAEGAFLEPLSGDFLFTTFGGGNRLVAIRGFTPNPQ